MVVGITGGIACGKSEVSNFLLSKNYKVIDADKISKDITNYNNEGYLLIKEHFGPSFIKDKAIDNKKLGKLVFSNLEQRNKLNSLLHPIIINKIKQEIKYSNEEIIFLDAPLLFETNLDKLCDKIIVIDAYEDIRINRIIKRDNISKVDALNRINSQMPLEQKIKKATYVIDNNKDIDNLKAQVLTVLERIK